MTLRTTTRLTGTLGILLLAVGTFVFVTAPTARALTQERITVNEGEMFTGTYGPILPANAAANVDGSTAINTEICTAAPYCDVIPLTIGQPQTFTEDDAEYYVSIKLEWPSVVIDNVPVLGETSATDLDLFIVNDPFDEEAGPDEDGFVYKSASSANPEMFTMFAPAGDWNILVDNYASGPTEYTITVEWKTAALPTPFESLPPEFTDTGSFAPSPILTPAVPSIVTPPPPAPIASPVFEVEAPATPSLAPSTPVIADTQFDTGFDDAAGLSDQLTSPTTQVAFTPASTEPADPPSAIALLLWLLAIPLILTAATGLFLERRQATVVQI